MHLAHEWGAVVMKIREYNMAHESTIFDIGNFDDDDDDDVIGDDDAGDVTHICIARVMIIISIILFF